MQPKVSVIIPVYNVEKYLSKAIESVISQTLKDIEIILIDDGSTDKSYSIIQSYATKDNRIRVLKQKNSGQSSARNKGIELSRGKYLYFMDSDDFIQLYTLEMCYSLCERKNLEMVYFNAISFSDDIEYNFDSEYYRKNKILQENKCYTGEKFLDICMTENKYIASVCLYFFRKDKLNGLLFYEGIYHEDELFTLLLINKINSLEYINKNFYNRRYRFNSVMTQKFTLKHIVGRYTVIKELEKLEENEIKKNNIDRRIKQQVNAIIDICIENNLRNNDYYQDIVNNYKELIETRFLFRIKYFYLYKFYKLSRNTLKKIIKRK